MFYFQLCNLYFEYRFRLKLINLLVIVEYRYLKKYGIDEILKLFVSELNVFGDDMGYDFNIMDGIVRFIGVLFVGQYIFQ